MCTQAFIFIVTFYFPIIFFCFVWVAAVVALIAMHFLFIYLFTFFGGIRMFGNVTLYYFWSCSVYYSMFDHNRHIVKRVACKRARRVEWKTENEIQVLLNRCYSLWKRQLRLVFHVNNNDSTCTSDLFVFARLCAWGLGCAVCEYVSVYAYGINMNIIWKISLCDIIIKLGSMCVSLNWSRFRWLSLGHLGAPLQWASCAGER